MAGFQSKPWAGSLPLQQIQPAVSQDTVKAEKKAKVPGRSMITSRLLGNNTAAPSQCSVRTTTILDWAKGICKDDEGSSTTESSTSLTQEEDQQETLAVKALVKAVFDRTLAEPMLSRFLGSQVSSCRLPTSRKRVKNNDLQSDNKRMKVTDSDCSKMNLINSLTPQEYLCTMFEARGEEVKTFSALDLPNFFCEITDDFVKAYDMEVMKAVREQDIDALRRMHGEGKTLQCGNRFGESIVHAACRRGSYPVLSFLMQEVGVTCKIRCDYGRTPLHDACWTPLPNWQVIELLLDACPDMLYITDKRGLTPLAYTRPEHAADWFNFLTRRGIERLLPKELK